jgi:hypothetical protein
VLELPIFDPSVDQGSVYLWYDTSAGRQRPSGYSTTAPKAAKRIADRLQRLNCGDWSDGTAAMLERLGVHAIVVHLGLYNSGAAASFAVRSLGDHGWTVQRNAGPVLLFERSASGSVPVLAGPSRAVPLFCQGWYGDTGHGRYMSERHAPLWVYGRAVSLRFSPSPEHPRVTVYGGHTRGWHLVTVDVSHLIHVPGEKNRVGAKLLGLRTSP